MNENKKVMFNYKFNAPSLEEQANQQGYTLGIHGPQLNSLRRSALSLKVFLELPNKMYYPILRRLNAEVVKRLRMLRSDEQLEIGAEEGRENRVYCENGSTHRISQ